LPHPCRRTAAGWVSSNKGTPLVVTPIKWKQYIPSREKRWRPPLYAVPVLWRWSHEQIRNREIRRSGTTVLLVEQRLTECLEMADRAYILQTGRVVLAGTAADIARNADVRRLYLGLWSCVRRCG
jgi:hypothetical protein